MEIDTILIVLVIIFFIIHTVILAISQSKIPRETQGFKAYQAMAIVTTYLAYLFLLWAYYDRYPKSTTKIIIVIFSLAFLIGFVVHSSRFVNNLRKEESIKLIYAHILLTVIAYICVLAVYKNLPKSGIDILKSGVDIPIKLKIAIVVEKDLQSDRENLKKEVQAILTDSKKLSEKNFEFELTDDLENSNIIINFLSSQNIEKAIGKQFPTEKDFQSSTPKSPLSLAVRSKKEIPRNASARQGVNNLAPSYILIDKDNWYNEHDNIQEVTGLDKDEYKNYVILHHIMHVLGYDDLPCDETTIDTKNNACPVMYPVLEKGCYPHNCGYQLSDVDFNQNRQASSKKTFFFKK